WSAHLSPLEGRLALRQAWFCVTRSRRRRLARRAGALGGRARAEALSPERRREIARLAARARWEQPRSQQAAGPAQAPGIQERHPQHLPCLDCLWLPETC